MSWKKGGKKGRWTGTGVGENTLSKYCPACPLEGWDGDTEKNGPSQRMEQLERPRHREKSKVRPMIRFVFLKVALDKSPRMG